MYSARNYLNNIHDNSLTKSSIQALQLLKKHWINTFLRVPSPRQSTKNPWASAHGKLTHCPLFSLRSRKLLYSPRERPLCQRYAHLAHLFFFCLWSFVFSLHGAQTKAGFSSTYRSATTAIKVRVKINFQNKQDKNKGTSQRGGKEGARKGISDDNNINFEAFICANKFNSCLLVWVRRRGSRSDGDSIASEESNK